MQSRNSLSLADARARLAAQNPLASKLVYADYVIDNSGPLADLTLQVDRIVHKLQQRAGWSWVLSWLIPPWGLARGLWRVGWRLWIEGVGQDKARRTRGERKDVGTTESMELKDRRSGSSKTSGSSARL